MSVKLEMSYEECLYELIEFKNQLKLYLMFLQDKERLSGEDSITSKKMFKEIKDKLEEESKFLANSYNKGNRFITAFYKPAIRDAKKEIYTQINSPDSFKIGREIAGAIRQITWYIDQLKKVEYK